VQVATGDYHTLVIREDGTLWAWGGASGNDGSVQSSLGQVSGRHGQLGLGDNYQRHIPTQVGTDNDWHYVAAGGTYSLAIKTDGTLWAWGNNAFGQLGLGDTVNRNIPVQVGTDSDWQNIFLGLWSSYAIKSDGTLWSWGNNSSNQLGLGSSTENRNVPTQVGTDSNWQSGSAHMLHALAMRDDGTLWAWGGRDRPLGVPQISTNRFTPTQVVPGSTWLEVSTHSGHTLAIRDDGTLWAWGNNLHGRLGIDGLSVTNSPPGNATLPTQVGSDNNWQSIAAGGIHSIAIRDDGTLWAWGNGHAGALGIPRPNPGQGNDPVPTPVQVRDETNWESIFAGHQFSTAIRSDGNIWVTGQNRGGQLAKAVSSNWYVIGAPDGYGRQDQRFWRLSASLAPSAWNIWSNADNAVTPNHAQLDVEMDIDTLTVRFDRPMRTDAASLGTITLDNGASVDLSQATWSSGTHVGIVLGDNEIPDSVLTVPLELTASGTVHTATISGFIDAQFGLRGVNEMHPHTWTFRTESILEVTDEFPAGDSVAVNTPSLVITFSEAVNHTAGTRMITISGGEYMHVIPVPADAGIWNAERTVLTLPIPEGFLEYATQYTVNISGFTAVAGGTLASHQHTFTTESASLADTFSVMEVLPTGNRVAIDVESLVITFSASVNPTAGTPSVTIVGGELDHSFDVASAVVPVSEPGAWNAERTVLTLAMPEELEYATQYTVDITGFVSVEDAELIDYTHNFRTVSEPLEGLFTKTLELPEGTTVPSPTFSFNFAPYQVVLDDSVTPNISSRPTADFATLLTNQSISLSAADAVTIDGVTTIAGALDIASILSNLSFPGGGVYVWNVSEVAGSSSTTTPS
jgi:alpha-tubulin suppressor-like RCC1 family protein